MMPSDDQEDTTLYKVVVNHEEQYSIWPAERDNPLGWRDVGTSGLKQTCLDYIAAVWTDMRPLSLRKHMAAASRRAVDARYDESRPLESAAARAAPGPTAVMQPPAEVTVSPRRPMSAE